MPLQTSSYEVEKKTGGGDARKVRSSRLVKQAFQVLRRSTGIVTAAFLRRHQRSRGPLPLRSRHRELRHERQQRVDNTSSAFAIAVIEILPDLLVRPTAGWGRRAVFQVDYHGLSGIDISSHRVART